MEAQEKYEYWLDIATYDLETAEAMHNAGRWLYVVFMCEQAVEKLVKGLYTIYLDDNVPRTHNIAFLVKKFESLMPEAVTGEQYGLFADLTSHYVNGRYSDFKQKLSRSLDRDEASDILRRSKEVFEWLLTMKP